MEQEEEEGEEEKMKGEHVTPAPLPLLVASSNPHMMLIIRSLRTVYIADILQSLF